METTNFRYGVYAIISILIISAFFTGNLLGYVVMDDLPQTDSQIDSKFDDEEVVRVIISKKDTKKKAIIGSSAANTLNEAINKSAIKPILVVDRLNMAVAEITREEYVELKKNRALKYIKLDEPVFINLNQSTQFINSKESNKLVVGGENITGKGFTACVIDTGIDYTHPSLGGCTSEEFEAGICAKVIGGTNIIYQDTDDPMDDNGHGTHVSGILAGNYTLRGVAPDAKLVAVKALGNQGGGYTSDLIYGVQWCVDNKDQYNITVISISAGGITTYSTFCDSSNTQGATAINNAVNANINVVVATGNDGLYTGVNFPACLSNAIPVTSVNGNTTYASTANRGINFPNLIAAPGVNILSAYPEGYAYMSGTSMATPHVSGAILLYQQMSKQVNDTRLSDAEIKNLLISYGNELYDIETNKVYPYLQTLNAILSLHNLTPNVELNVDPLVVNESENNYVLINWSSNSYIDFNTTILISNQTTNIFTSNNISGQLNLSNLTRGKYFVNISSENSNGETSVFEEFFVKISPKFDFLIENKTSIFGYFGEYNISINVSIGDIENITLYLNDELIELDVLQNISLSVGNYTFTAIHEQTTNYFEDQVSLFLQIQDSFPIIINTTPENSELIMYENDTMQFLQESINPIDGNLTFLWIENNEIVSYNDSYLFIAKNKSYINLTLTVINDEGNVTNTWLISILPAPLHVIKFPEQDQVLEFNDTINFTLNVIDVFNRTIYYNWTINNSKYYEDFYFFNATNFNFGNYTLRVNVTNNLIYDVFSWNISVMPEPYIFFKSNISDVVGETNKNIILYADNYFEYYLQGDMPTYSLSNLNIPYILSNNNVVINSDEELELLTKIIAEYDDETIESNEFKLIINNPPRVVSSGGGGGGAPLISYSIEDDVELNETEHVIEIDSEEEVESLRIRVSNENVEDTSVIIQSIKIEEENILVVEEFEGRIYKSYQIKLKENNTNTKLNTTLEFEVEKSWLELENLDIDDVALFRYTTIWEELPTKVKEEFQDRVIYETITPGFSYFIIGERKKESLRIEEPVEIEIINSDDDTEILLVVVIILIIAIIIVILNVLLNQKRKKKDVIFGKNKATIIARMKQKNKKDSKKL